MTKNTVVKTLTKPPMAKKEKPLEITAKEEPKPDIKIVEKKRQKEVTESMGLKGVKKEVKPVNSFMLQEKKK